MNDPTSGQRFDAIEGLLVQQYRDISTRLRRMEEQHDSPQQEQQDPPPTGKSLQDFDQFFLKQRDAFSKSIQAALPTRPNPPQRRGALILLVLLNLISLGGHIALALWR